MKTPGHLLAVLAWSSTAVARLIPSNANQINQASKNNGGLDTEGVETLDGVSLDAIPEGRAAPAANSQPLANTGWTATADSYQNGNPPSNAIDGNANTFWHSEYSPVLTNLPHYLLIDTKNVQLINSISYQPRQDNFANGNIGQHTITLSTDGVTFTQPKVIGTWLDDQSTKTSVFEATSARYVKLTAITEAGNRGPWSSCAELQIFTTTTPAPNPGHISGGRWSPTIDFPLVPVSAALIPTNGNLLVWSSYAASTFGGSSGTQTLTAYYYPGSQTVSQRTITNVNHDMFCEGLNMDSRGRILSTGGNTAQAASLYDFSSDSWSALPNMNIQRGYAAQTTVSDGRSFTIGGSWSGGTGGKNGEIYSISRNTWTVLPGCPVQNMLTNDAQGVYRADNHGWLFAWSNNYVFQAGPSKQMNWYNVNGAGSVAGAGNRGSDTDAMCGNAVMFDAVAGKILTVGGATSYQGVDATSNANVITIAAGGGQQPQVQQLGNMNYQRIFANAVVLPNSWVFIVGGQVYGQPFSDDTAQLTPEMFVPSTGHFITTSPFSIPRVYHSVAVLLADATVFTGGGGLCGACATNHYDGQVYTPGYLFNADGTPATRPVISQASAQVTPGGTITATTTGTVGSWAMIRVASTTHTVNTDQRRIVLNAKQNGNSWSMTVPNDYGILLPGYWMLFAMDQNNVPSLAKYVLVPR